MSLRKLEGIWIFLFVVKEPTYNMIMMSTYSGIVVRDDQKEEYRYSKWKVITFKYT